MSTNLVYLSHGQKLEPKPRGPSCAPSWTTALVCSTAVWSCVSMNVRWWMTSHSMHLCASHPLLSCMSGTFTSSSTWLQTVDSLGCKIFYWVSTRTSSVHSTLYFFFKIKFLLCDYLRFTEKLQRHHEHACRLHPASPSVNTLQSRYSCHTETDLGP